MASNEVKRKPFRWTAEMTSHLISCVETYKAMCEFEGKDFDTDRPMTMEYLTMDKATHPSPLLYLYSNI